MLNRDIFLELNLLLEEPWKGLIRKYGGDGTAVFSLAYLMAERERHEALPVRSVLNLVSYTLCLDAEFVWEILQFCADTGLFHQEEFERGDLFVKGNPLAFLEGGAE